MNLISLLRPYLVAASLSGVSTLTAEVIHLSPDESAPRMWTSAEIGSGAFSLKADQTHVFKTVSNQGQPVELEMHAFLPEGYQSTDKRPAIVFFHGGGWYGGTPDQFYPQCRYLAMRGMVAFSAEYRCINEFKTTPKECVMDGKSAVRWVRQHAAELRVDPKRIAAGGDSAGGHIAAATALAKGYEEEGADTTTSCRPDALVLYNPVFDNGPNGFGHNLVKDYWKEISPIDNVDAHSPPAMVILGTKDEYIPVETGRRFEHLMKENGIRCDLYLYEGKPHSFFNIWNRREDLAETTIKVDRFLTSLGYLKGEPIFKLTPQDPAAP
jgi:acetyl esterase